MNELPIDRYDQTGMMKRRLSGRTERRGSQTGFSAAGIGLFGGVFVAVGIAIMLVGTKVIHVNPSDVHAPFWVLTVIGAVFTLAGAMVWSMALRQYRSQRRRMALDALMGEPALKDYDWDPRGFTPSRWMPAAKAAGGSAVLTVFLSIFNYWAFVIEPGNWLLKGVVILFDLINMATWWEALTRLGRALKFGGSQVVFTQFPYRVSAPVSIHWIPAEGIEAAAKGTFALRCVAEWYENTGSETNRSATLVHEEQWCGTWTLERNRAFQQGVPVELRFEPPPECPPTRLNAELPFFWEFEVSLDMPGLDFTETYLIPVYPYTSGDGTAHRP